MLAPTVTHRISGSVWSERIVIVGVWCLLVFAAKDFFTGAASQYRQTEQKITNGLYYTFEYKSLVEHVREGKPFDFDGARGWRRGPASYLWMWPLAKFFGLQLAPRVVFVLQWFIIAACIWLTTFLYKVDRPLLLTLPLYSAMWLGATTVQYRVGLGDINSLFGFALLPMASFAFLSLGKYGFSGIGLSIASHFRILNVGELLYLVVRHRRTILPIFITSVIILLLGTLLVSPLQGYLYWTTLANDVLFSGTSVRSAASPWHENIALSGIFLKVFTAFHFGDRYVLSPSPSIFNFSKTVTALTQLVVIVSILRIFIVNRSYKSDRLLLLNEFGFASLLTYFLAPEYGNDFLITLMPAFLFGLFIFLDGRLHLSTKWWITYAVSIFFTLNIVGYLQVCKLIPFGKLHTYFGNTVGFICYENINVYLISVIGIFLNIAFLFHSRRQILKSLPRT